MRAGFLNVNAELRKSPLDRPEASHIGLVDSAEWSGSRVYEC
jgi:hypothetical protein